MKFGKRELTKEMIKFILFVAFVLFLVNVVFSLNYIPSGSMEPTLKPGDITVSFCGAYLFKEPQAGDVIIFRSSEGKTMVKRIVGVPEDEITIKDGKVFLNGTEIEEGYLPEGTETIAWGQDSYTVPEGHYFVMGDNRMDSADSRFWPEPFVPTKNIKAKLLFVVPTSRIYEFISFDFSCD